MTGELPRDPIVGTQVGEYKVTGILGTGGMSVVYEGVHEQIGKRVAIKALHLHFAETGDLTARLMDEARLVNAIHHPGIVDIFSTGTLPDGRRYIAMELLEGQSLEQIIARQAPLEVTEALELLEAMLDPLEAAHKAGVIHRDLKPSNIFVNATSTGQRFVKLLDFGLAKRERPDLPEGKRPTVAGTPEYIAPEQARGMPVDARTDLYALGCVAFEMLTKQVPFEGPDPLMTMTLHATAKRPRVRALRPTVPPAVDELVFKLMQIEPDQRYRSASEVRAVLGRITRELRMASTGATAAPPEGLALKSRRWPWLLAVGVLLAAGAGATWIYARNDEAKPEPGPPTAAENGAAIAATAVRDRLDAGQLTDAASALEEARRKYAGAPELAATEAELLARVDSDAEALMHRGQYRKAAELFTLAGRLAPKDQRALLGKTRAERDALGEESGMARIGDLWIDRYEWPNREGAEPLAHVDFEQAQKLCAESHKRLCTEEEWERACAGEAHRAFPYGNAYAAGACQTRAKGPKKSGAMARCATPEGVFDLSGNLAEWTSSAISPGQAQRVLRGGDWHQSGDKVSCGARDYFMPGMGGAKTIGFRCCL